MYVLGEVDYNNYARRHEHFAVQFYFLCDSLCKCLLGYDLAQMFRTN